MTNYSIGDFLIQLKNAGMADKREVTTQSNKLIKAVANVLEKSKYLESVEENDGNITVKLAYHKKQPILVDIKLVSRPGLRVYRKVDEINRHRGISKFIISTPDGIMLSTEAKKKRVGGEVIAEIW